jgi:hypothetical protein
VAIHPMHRHHAAQDVGRRTAQRVMPRIGGIRSFEAYQSALRNPKLGHVTPQGAFALDGPLAPTSRTPRARPTAAPAGA